MTTRRVPVIALTGYLGAGKTTVLNHLLRTPGARLGVVVNDFGDIDVDAALVTGQVDEPASVAGGCLCCMPDAGGLEAALERLARPHLDLDAVVVEASGMAEPPNLVRLIRSCPGRRTRFAGLVDVVDAVHEGETVDTAAAPPARYGAATLVVVTKTDLLAPPRDSLALARIGRRVHARNPRATVVAADRGRIDPLLVLDVAHRETPADQLPLAEIARQQREEDERGHRDGVDHEPHSSHHAHADAVTVRARGPVDPGRLVDLLEAPPAGVYRLKGLVETAGAGGTGGRRLVVNAVAGQVHLEAGRGGAPVAPGLVAIGPDLDRSAVTAALREALVPAETVDPADVARLERMRRRSDGM